jgi:hypothetical protein
MYLKINIFHLLQPGITFFTSYNLERGAEQSKEQQSQRGETGGGAPCG